MSAAPWTPGDQAWADQEGAAQRSAINAEYAREAANPARITPVEIVMRRECLGLSQTELARLLGVEDRAVRRWEAGDRGMLGKHEDTLMAIEEAFEDLVDAAAAALKGVAPRDRVIVTYRTQAALDAAHSQAPWPASMQRAIAWTVCDQVTDARPVFAPES